MLLDFLVIVFFVFVLGTIVLKLAVRSPSHNSPCEAPDPNRTEQLSEPEEPKELEELAEAISHDNNLLTPTAPVQVPHVDLPGVKLGGGALDEPCSKAVGTVTLKSDKDPNERRTYNRRLRDRREADTPPEKERRILQRRVWLRREEDRHGKQLLTIVDAADTLGVHVEQIYKWLDGTDIPFYQVTEGNRKAIRFDVNELLQWHSKIAPGSREPQQDA
ncbi:MAG: helix-turn-helix domain-containing protein [Candidatus Hydrogenedentota bacterium]|nr:MAG: helix-turn-helix domain-containing protein [Candidatus Hydrogenedentota bacterium]